MITKWFNLCIKHINLPLKKKKKSCFVSLIGVEQSHTSYDFERSGVNKRTLKFNPV